MAKMKVVGDMAAEGRTKKEDANINKNEVIHTGGGGERRGRGCINENCSGGDGIEAEHRHQNDG